MDVLAAAGPLLALAAALLIPVVAIVGLLWLAKRRLDGRRSRLDNVLGGVARGGVMSSHLKASTPHPDDIANPARRH